MFEGVFVGILKTFADTMKGLRAAAGALMIVAAFALLAPPAHATISYVVSDAETGTILLARNANRRHPPASLVKMMTLYLTFEALDAGRLKLTQRLKVSRHAARQRPSKLGLKAGRTITVKDAILAMATKSANDVAVVIAEALGGSERAFAKIMTRKARKLGMRQTIFRNASGLPKRGQFSTARDMAILARALIVDYPHHYYIFATRNFWYGGRRYKNHNKLLANYPGVDGIKTGYTRASRFNVAISAVRGGHRVIAIVFGGRTAKRRDRLARNLLNRVYGSRAPARKLRKRVRKRHVIRRVKARPAPPPLKTPNAARPAHRAAPSQPGWGIQVGAYRDYWAALRRARTTRNRLPVRFGLPKLVVSATGRTRRTLYRAQLYGLSSREAREACAFLGRHCMLLAPTRVAKAG